MNRSATITPFTGSTGQVTYQPTTSTVRPARLAIVHSVSARRRLLVTGICEPFAAGARKPSMPCCSGSLPVAIVVQMRGEIVGSIERSGALHPSATRRANVGSRPAAASGRMTSQVAASMPIRSTRSPVGPGTDRHPTVATRATPAASRTRRRIRRAVRGHPRITRPGPARPASGRARDRGRRRRP